MGRQGGKWGHESNDRNCQGIQCWACVHVGHCHSSIAVALGTWALSNLTSCSWEGARYTNTCSEGYKDPNRIPNTGSKTLGLMRKVFFFLLGCRPIDIKPLICCLRLKVRRPSPCAFSEGDAIVCSAPGLPGLSPCLETKLVRRMDATVGGSVWERQGCKGERRRRDKSKFCSKMLSRNRMFCVVIKNKSIVLAVLCRVGEQLLTVSWTVRSYWITPWGLMSSSSSLCPWSEHSIS